MSTHINKIRMLEPTYPTKATGVFKGEASGFSFGMTSNMKNFMILTHSSSTIFGNPLA